MQRKVIGVFPAGEYHARARLCCALEEALSVRFEGRQWGDEDGLDAAIWFGTDPPTGVQDPQVPWLRALSEEGEVPAPPALGQKAPATGPRVRMERHNALDRRLHGLCLLDAGAEYAPPLPVHDGDTLLATAARGAVWITRSAATGPRDVVAMAPAELAADEPLRDRLRNGRFLATLALVHFLRSVCADLGWQTPPLRACFMFDDPNLHWTSYGYIKYRELLRDAEAHDYHVSFATVPLDSWFVHPAAARLFREHTDRLSFVMHGNNHAREELTRFQTVASVRANLAQAIARVRAFERRAGLSVARIMVPPHGVCSQSVAEALAPLGFDALCVSRPFPWLARPPHPWLERPADASPLTGWHPASLVGGGLPVILRRGFNDPPEDLALRAFLNQPLIIHGHHNDLADGLDQLRDLAATVRRIGDVQWISVAEMSASNLMTRREGDVLRVRLFTRRARVTVPDGVRELRVEAPTLQEAGGLVVNGLALSPSASPGELRPLPSAGPGHHAIAAASGGEVELTVRSPKSDVQPASHPSTGWLVTRRFATEGRDRLAPTYRRARTTLARFTSRPAGAPQ